MRVAAPQAHDLECGGRAKPEKAMQGRVVVPPRHRFGFARRGQEPDVGWPSRFKQSVRAILALVLCYTLPATAAFVDRSDLFPPGTLLFDYSSWADFNNDGWPDIYDSAGVRINQGGTSFTSFTGYGRAVHGDINNDGFIDILDYDVPVRALINDGTGTSFSEIPFPVLPLGDLTCRGASLGDQNGDGYIDVYVGGYENTSGAMTFQDTFVWNNSGTSFSAVLSKGPRRPLRIVW